MNKLKQVEPQLARGAFREELWESPEWVAEEKYDGDRRIAQFIGAKLALTGRRKSVKDGLFIDKADNVLHLKPGPREMMLLQGAVLDGEICLPSGYRLEHGEPASKYVTSIMGSKPPEALRKQRERGFLRYVIFDLVHPTMMQALRRDEVLRLVKLWNNEHVQHSMQAIKEKRRMYEDVTRSGGEGVILKNQAGLYGDHKSWVKVKNEFTADVVIMGFKAAKEESTKSSGETSRTKYAEAGLIGAVEFGQYHQAAPHGAKEPRKVGFCSGMDDATRAMFSAAPKKWTGKVMEIKHNGREPKTGALRHPRFVRLRDDKKATDCVYRENET